MMKRWIASALLASTVCLPQLCTAQAADWSQLDDCGCGPRPMRLAVRHIEAKGIGYRKGYTTLEGFFPWVGDNWIPFLDLRGHVFNDGKFAANAGLGLRYANSRIWGANVYYDYRKTHHHHYNQIDFGLESLGTRWDFRANGWVPIGTTKSGHFDTAFDGFQGHHLILSHKREFAMAGANAEMGIHVDSIEDAPLYFATGPYYLHNRGRNVWGGEGRIALDYLEYMRLELSGSYDHLFHGIVQGQVTLTFPFGSRKAVRQPCNKSCCESILLSQRAVQRVDRNEIIAVHSQKSTRIAIDPTTSAPLTFWFVDNLSGSDGIFEDPFPTLLEAQNASSSHHIIYVFPGDGTSNGMDAGIVLKDNQRLLGAGLSYAFDTTRGPILVPAMATGLPLITNAGASTSGQVILAANNNEIAGLEIAATPVMWGILAESISSGHYHDNLFQAALAVGISNYSIGIGVLTCEGLFTIDHNTFNVSAQKGTGGGFLSGVYTYSNTGEVVIRDNSFNISGDSNHIGLYGVISVMDDCVYPILDNQFTMANVSTSPNQAFVGVYLDQPSPDAAYTIAGNNLSSDLGDTVTGVLLENSSNFARLFIENNSFFGMGSSAHGGRAISGTGLVGSGIIGITNNSFDRVDSSSSTPADVLLELDSGADIIMIIKENSFTHASETNVAVVNASSGATSCIILENNVSDLPLATTAYLLNNSAGGVMNATVSDNVGTVTTSGPVGTTPCH